MKQLMMILMCALCALSCRRVPLYDAESGVYLKLYIHIHADIDLPETCGDFADSVWTTSNANVITADGHITRPAYGKPTATATLCGATTTNVSTTTLL